MRIVFALLVMGLLILPAGCGGGEEEVSEVEGPTTPVEDPTSEEDLNAILPPPE